MRWCWIVACAVIGCGFGLRSALLLGKDPPHKLPIACFPSSSLAALGLQCWVLSLAKLTTDFSCLHNLRPLASSLRHGLSHLDKCDHSRGLLLALSHLVVCSIDVGCIVAVMDFNRSLSVG